MRPNKSSRLPLESKALAALYSRSIMESSDVVANKSLLKKKTGDLMNACVDDQQKCSFFGTPRQ